MNLGKVTLVSVVVVCALLFVGVAKEMTLRVWTMMTVQTQLDEITRQCQGDLP